MQNAKKEIVIFSEDALSSDALKFTLESKGFVVHSYVELREGLKHIVVNPPSLIIIDDIKSGPSPSSIVRGIRKKLSGFDKPFLFVLDPPQTGSDLEAYDSKIDGYIERPYSLATMLELVNSLLGIDFSKEKPPASGSSQTKSDGKKSTQYDPELMAFVVSDKKTNQLHKKSGHAETREGTKSPAKKEMWLDSLSPLDESESREHLDLLGDSDLGPSNEPVKGRKSSKKAKQFKAYKGTIMVIDDERFIIKILQTVLEADGYRVITANNGLEGMKKCKNIIPDLILLDLMMPELDGYEFTEILRSDKNFKDIPIIILSARPLSQDHGEAFKLGVDFYMQKPIDREKLLGVIANLIETS